MKIFKTIIEILIMIAIFVGGAFLAYKFTNKIHKEKLDTTYMWNVKYQNIKVTEGSKEGETKESKNGISISVTLKDPKEFYEVTFDVENYGSLDAYVNEVISKVNSTDNILTSSISYLDGKEIKKGDKLKSGEKKTIKIRIDYPKQKEKIYKELKLDIEFSIHFKADS